MIDLPYKQSWNSAVFIPHTSYPEGNAYLSKREPCTMQRENAFPTTKGSQMKFHHVFSFLFSLSYLSSCCLMPVQKRLSILKIRTGDETNTHRYTLYLPEKCRRHCHHPPNSGLLVYVIVSVPGLWSTYGPSLFLPGLDLECYFPFLCHKPLYDNVPGR